MKVKKTEKASNLVTRQVLREELRELTTKKELKSEIALVRLDMKEAFDKHEEKHREYRDEILTKLDGVMGELQTMREENTAGTDLLDDHEKRITALESSV